SEGLVAAGDNHRADVLVRLERSKRTAQFTHQFGRQRIECLRPIEDDQADLVSSFNQNVCVSHDGVSKVERNPIMAHAQRRRCEQWLTKTFYSTSAMRLQRSR